MSDGAVPGVKSRDVVERHAAEPRRRHRQRRDGRLRSCGSRPARAQVHLVLLAAFVVGRHLIAADQQPQRLGRVGDLHAEVGRLRPVDAAPTAPACRRSATCRRRRRPACFLTRATQLLADRVQLLEIGPVDDELDVGVLRCRRRRWSRPAAPTCAGSPRAAAGSRLRTLVHDGELIARPRSRSASGARRCCRGCASAPDRRRW